MKPANLKALLFRDIALHILSMLGLSGYVLVDTLFIATRLGADGLAALNLALPLFSCLHGCGLMLGLGGGSQYALAQSRHDNDEARRRFTASAALAAALSLLFLLPGLFHSGTIVRLLGADAALRPMTQSYLRVILLCAPLFLLNNLLLGFIRNNGASTLAMAAMLGGSAANIVLDYLFIFPLDLGMFGAALATGLAPLASLLILAPFFGRRQSHQLHFLAGGLTLRRAGTIVVSGMPAWISECSAGVVMLVFNLLILRLQGNIGVAAYGIIANLSLIVLAIYNGIAQGMQPLLSRSHGAGRADEVRMILRHALGVLLIITCLIQTASLAGAAPLIRLFNRGGHRLLQQTAETGLSIYFTGALFAGFNMIMAIHFTATERPGSAHAIAWLRGLLLIVPMAFLLAASAGMTGVWATFPASEILVSLLAVFLLCRSAPRKPRRFGQP